MDSGLTSRACWMWVKDGCKWNKGRYTCMGVWNKEKSLGGLHYWCLLCWRSPLMGPVQLLSWDAFPLDYDVEGLKKLDQIAGSSFSPCRTCSPLGVLGHWSGLAMKDPYPWLMGWGGGLTLAIQQYISYRDSKWKMGGGGHYPLKTLFLEGFNVWHLLIQFPGKFLFVRCVFFAPGPLAWL